MDKKNIKIIKYHLFSLFLLNGIINAQDAHYWNLSYGTTATLLGGSVIGSVSDLSATFYNPGMLGLKRDAELVLGARVFEIGNLSISSPKTDAYQLSSTKFRPSPSFVAGTFLSDSLKQNRLSYSVLTRQYFDFSLEGRYSEFTDGENINNEIVLQKNMIDVWAGVTWSHRYGDNIGLGVTQFISILSDTRRTNIVHNKWNQSNNISTHQIVKNYSYYNVRTLWKIGVGFNYTFASFGLTVTTPSINIFGSGDSYYSEISNNIEIPTLENPHNFFATDYQEDLSSNYKNSWAVGIGGAYRINKSRLHLSAEWYNAVKKYDVLNQESFSGQSGHRKIDYTLKHQAKSIINYGFGFEFEFIKEISGFASLVTDYSTVVPNSEANLELAEWNIYHVTAGSSFDFWRVAITTGIEYAFGRKSGLKLFDSISSASNTIININDETKVNYNRYKLILVIQVQI